MNWYEILIWLTVGCAVLFAARRNPTALALIFSWLTGEFYYILTDNNLALSQYFITDIMVIAVIYSKTIWRVGPKNYPTFWLHLKCFFIDLTICDRIIVGIFLLGVWPIYIFNLHPYYKWWALYWLTILQFLSAIVEALLYKRQKEIEKEQSPSANILPFIRPGAEPVKIFDTQLDGGSGARC